VAAAAARRGIRPRVILKRNFQGKLIITIKFWHSKGRQSVDELTNRKFHHIASVNTVTECNNDGTNCGLIHYSPVVLR
jgi:hypothetical protein